MANEEKKEEEEEEGDEQTSFGFPSSTFGPDQAENLLLVSRRAFSSKDSFNFLLLLF